MRLPDCLSRRCWYRRSWPSDRPEITLPRRLLPFVTARPRTQAMPDNNQNARHEMWTAIVLLWLAGNALRLTILAVPPVIAMIRDEFALSATEVGLLSSIPPALFAIAALAGTLLVARLGVRAALIGGLMLVAAGSALRGLSTSYALLFADRKSVV